MNTLNSRRLVKAFTVMVVGWAIPLLSSGVTNAPANSQPVSYQFQDSILESTTSSTVSSPVVSYQYLDWPGNASVTQQSSPTVSYYYQGSSTTTGVPVVTGVNPSPVPAQNGSQIFTIVGSNFNTGCSVTLRALATGQVFPNRSISSQTFSQIVLNPNFGSTSSTWSVEVISSSGASSGQFKFQVGTQPSLISVAPQISSTFYSANSTRTFVLTNNSSATISGTATVTGPFSIVGNAGYSLAPGQTQSFTVTYNPTAVGTQTGTLSFSGGSGASQQLTGQAISTPTLGTITGQVVDATTSSPINGATVLALAGGLDVTEQSPQTSTKGSFTITGITPGIQILSVNALGYDLQVINGVSVTPGGTTNIGVVKLHPLLTSSQIDNFPENIPILFVRGMGGVQQPDNYWSAIKSSLQSYIPKFVNIWDPNSSAQILDGTQSVEFNATALTYYVGDMAKAYYQSHNHYPTINVVTHSMGGVVVREALNNTNYFTCTIDGSTVQIPVKKVVMLAPPNVGSRLANYSLFNWASFLGHQVNPPWFSSIFIPTWDSTKSLTMANMRGFNLTHKFSPNVQVFTLAGTGGITSLNPDTIPGKIVYGYLQHDGAVSVESAQGIDDIYGNQSINVGPNFFIDSLAIGGDVDDHFSILTDSLVPQWIANILLTGNSGPVHSPSVSSTITKYSALAKASTANSPSPALQTIDLENGYLSSGSTTNLSITSDAASQLVFSLTADQTNLLVSLIDPNGHTINSGSLAANPTVTYSATSNSAGTAILFQYVVNSPVAGTWKLVLSGSNLTQGANYQAQTSGDSYVTLTPTTSPFFHSNREISLGCSVLNDSSATPTPVTGCTVTLQIVCPDGTSTTASLYDDGLHADGNANDGAYGAVLPGFAVPGQYQLLYKISGTNSSSLPFTRTIIDSFWVSTEDAGISGGIALKPIPSDPSGTPASMLMNALVTANLTGNYKLTGQLVDPSGAIVSPGSVDLQSLPAGTTTGTLNFDLTPFQNANFRGTAYVKNLQLFEVTSNGVQWVDSYQDTIPVYIGPVVTSTPSNLTINQGGNVNLSYGISDEGNLTYQWLFNGQDLTGQTSPNLTLTSVDPSQTGNYSLVATDALGYSTTTSSVTVTINGTTDSTDTPTMPEWMLLLLDVSLAWIACFRLKNLSPIKQTSINLSLFILIFFFSGFQFMNLVHADALDDCVTREMGQHDVPGLSLAIIHNGQIISTRTYGNFSTESRNKITPETLFQAGSVSKVVSAIGALQRVQQGKLSLDEDVNVHLKDWKVPENEFTRDKKVTVRRILSHTAGFNVHGFPGYSRDSSLPTLTDILDGSGGSNTAAVRVESVPGSTWKYSGGGYIVLQKLMADVTGQEFPKLMADTVLTPLQMVHSTFEQPLPASSESLACSGCRNGETIPGQWHVYPEMAAAGLWTTPSDLALLLIALQKAKAGQNDGVISPTIAQLMTTPVMNNDGLGLFMSGRNNEFFGHNGRNAGFDSLIRASLTDGIVIMINTNDDSGVCNRIGQAAWSQASLNPPWVNTN